VDATSVAAGGDLHVTVHSPACAPAVLDLEIAVAIADSQDTVVQVGAAARGDGTAIVELEGHLVCLNGNRHRALLDGALQRIGALRHGLVASDAALRDGGCAGRRLAASVTSGVWVAGLRAHIHSLFIGKAQLHASAIAASVAVLGAVNELLLRERLQLARANLPGTLHGACGGEGPARAALALVLHRGHCTLGGPVHSERQLLALVLMHAKVGHVCPLLGGWLIAEACCGLVLLRGHVGELVETELQRLTLGILLCDGSQVCLECGLVCCIFITIVDLAVGLLVGLPVLVGCGRGNECCCCN